MDEHRVFFTALALYNNQEITINPETGEYDPELGAEIYQAFLAEHPDFLPFWEAENDEEEEIPPFPVVEIDMFREPNELVHDEEEASVISDEDFGDVEWPKHSEEEYVDASVLVQAQLLRELIVFRVLQAFVFNVFFLLVLYQSRRP